MHCTVKKTLRGRSQSQCRADRPSPAPAKAGVKDNQPTLLKQIAAISETAPPLESDHSHDRGRNRDERRTVTVFGPIDKLAGTDWHFHVAAIIRVQRNVFTRNSKTGLLHHSAETTFYVSNTPLTAARCRGYSTTLAD